MAHGSLESAELATRLDMLPLPRYEVSFAAMQQFRTGELGEYECANFSSEALSLSFVRTTAAIADQEHRGLLWVMMSCRPSIIHQHESGGFMRYRS